MTFPTPSPTCPKQVLPWLGLGRLTVRMECSIHSSSFFRPSFSFLSQIDVTTIPDKGSWLTLIKDGTIQFNTGANGIQRLDKVVELAKKYNIYVYFTLTNNWNPSPSDPSPSNGPVPRNNAPAPLPRNFLSNDYGQHPTLVELCALFPDWIF